MSRLTDESTSPERQREACERLCAERGWEVVDTAEDLDVSAGDTTPFERPQLGKWLAEPWRFDAIVVYRADRLARRLRDMLDMIDWAEDHSVTLVSATESHFDLSSPFGVMVVRLLAMVGEWELDAIRSRNRASYHYHHRAGRYKGGHTSLGYRAEKIDGEWRYTLDPVLAPIAREIADRLIGGETISAVCEDLNRRGVITPDNRHRQLQGRPFEPARWRTPNLRRALLSPAIIGQVVARDVIRREKGKPIYGEPYVVLGEDGLPVQRAEPVLSPETYARVRTVLEHDTGRQRATPVDAKGLLLQVVHCGVCGRRMYLTQRTESRSYYRCASGTVRPPCENRMYRREEADEFVTEAVMDKIGDLERHVRRFDPGEDTAAQIAELDATLGTLAASLTRFRPGPALDTVLAQVEALESQKAALAARPHRPAGIRWEPAGETFREWWLRVDDAERNLFLRDNRVRLDYTAPKGSKAVEIGLSLLYLDEMIEAVTGRRPTP